MAIHTPPTIQLAFSLEFPITDGNDIFVRNIMIHFIITDNYTHHLTRLVEPFCFSPLSHAQPPRVSHNMHQVALVTTFSHQHVHQVVRVLIFKPPRRVI